MTPITIDKLRTYAVRDPQALALGDDVLFVHLPTLSDEGYNTHRVMAYVEEATVTEVSEATYAELNPNYRGESERFHEKHLMIFYVNPGDQKIRHRHASDSGMVPYPGGFYNPTNFTVRRAELAEAGFEFLDEISEEYRAALEAYNSTIREYDYYLDEFRY